jgi:aminoglycoside phosphotransferase (APT) family kinase protein
MNAVAAGPSDLTPAWLSAVLGTEVRNVEIERIGTGQMGEAYRLKLDADGLPATLVAKLAAADDEARQRVSSSYHREVGFYQAVASTVDARTPHCWYAAIDDAGRYTLLLEDLAPRVPGVQAEGCTLAQAEHAVRNLAALHAPRWNDRALHDLPFVPPVTEEGLAFLGDITVAAAGEFVQRYERELDPADVDTLRASAAATTAWLLGQPERFTVLHGDYRLDNLLFPPDGGGDVAAVDWQTVDVGAPGRDLGYFLGTSLHIEDRREAQDDLVRVYHEQLVALGVTGYDLEQCIDDYRNGQLQGPMITALGAIYATGTRTPQSDAMFLAMVRRSSAAIRDLDVLDDLSR